MKILLNVAKDKQLVTKINISFRWHLRLISNINLQYCNFDGKG